MKPLQHLARTGYTAYGNHTGNLTHDGRPMPAWAELGERIQGAWTAAAAAIAKAAQTPTGAADTTAATPPRPSLGRIVLVPMDPTKNNGADIAPAVITRVWNDKVVNVRVLSDNQPRDDEWRTSVGYVDHLDTTRTIPDDSPQTSLWHWTWPPRT